MPKTPIRSTRNKLARFYAVGILAFAAIVGFVTVTVNFLRSLDVS